VGHDGRVAVEVRPGSRPVKVQDLLLELSSAAVLHGAQVLADRGAIDGESTVVLLATAGPYSRETLDGPPAGRRVEDPTDADALRAATAQSTGA